MKLIIDTPKKIWFTADTHYNHKNIVRGTSEWDNKDGTRQYDTVEEMNAALIRNINNNIGEDDIIFHMGDFSFGNQHNIWDFRSQIKCETIHLIYGNHDRNIKDNKLVWDGGDTKFPLRAHDLFASVQEYLYLTIHFTDDLSRRFLLQPNHTRNFALSHYPMKSWEGMMDGTIHLHGHVHLPMEQKWGVGKMLDVGVDGNDLKPYNLMTDIIYTMENREIVDVYKKNNK
jgi:calcineurin-like phosphoesterase family protein